MGPGLGQGAVVVSAAIYGPTLHDLRCRAAKLGVYITVEEEVGLTDEDFGPLFLFFGDGYHVCVFGLPPASVSVVLDCIERRGLSIASGYEASWPELWESLEPFMDEDGKPLRLRMCDGSDEVQQQYIRRCVQIERLKAGSGIFHP